MRSLITAILIAIALAFVFALVLNSIQQSTEMAFTSEAVRLEAASILTANNKMTDALLNGSFTILGAIIAAVFGYFGAVRAARAQIKALQEQSEEQRRRFQQSRHQKKYEVALALHSEAQRLAGSAERRIPALASRPGSSGRAPTREQMTILPIIRGEREDIGLLRDGLQDEVRDLVNKVDDYNSHIETFPRSAGGTFVVDQAGELEGKLKQLRDKAQSLAENFNKFISRVRDWRCQKCEAFSDEILDVIEGGQRKRCPVCSDTTRTMGARAVL